MGLLPPAIVVGIRIFIGRTVPVVKILLLTTGQPNVLPALDLLAHTILTEAADSPAIVDVPSADVILVDARTHFADARATCRMLHASGLSVPLIAIVSEAGLVTLSTDWCLDDVILHTAGPAETDARLQLAISRCASRDERHGHLIRAAELTMDSDTYTARLRGEPLTLTFKEFELLKYLAQHPGRVFSRDQLLREVWGYDYFGGTRTVDVHVRRLRAKLGPLGETMIGTVRQVGYKFIVANADPTPDWNPTGTADPSTANISGTGRR